MNLTTSFERAIMTLPNYTHHKIGYSGQNFRNAEAKLTQIYDSRGVLIFNDTLMYPVGFTSGNIFEGNIDLQAASHPALKGILQDTMDTPVEVQ